MSARAFRAVNKADFENLTKSEGKAGSGHCAAGGGRRGAAGEAGEDGDVCERERALAAAEARAAGAQARAAAAEAAAAGAQARAAAARE